MTEIENQATIKGDGQITNDLVIEDQVNEVPIGDELVPGCGIVDKSGVAQDGDDIVNGNLEDAPKVVAAVLQVEAEEFCTCEEDATNESNDDNLVADTEHISTNSGDQDVEDVDCQVSLDTTATVKEVDEDAANGNNNSSLETCEEGELAMIDGEAEGNFNQSAEDDDDDDEDDDVGDDGGSDGGDDDGDDDDDEEEDLVDPREKLKEACAGSAACKPLGRLLEKCNERVEDGDLMFLGETCTEELFNFLECVDHCVAKDIHRKLV